MTDVQNAAAPIASLPNLRDLGGRRAADGATVKSGLLFRTADFRGLTDDDAAKFTGLGIRTVYDLRSAAERTGLPDPDFPGVADIALDVLADAGTAIPANLDTVLSDPHLVHEVDEVLGGGKAVELITGTYRELVTLPSAQAAYRRFFAGLLGADETPAAFHCTTGKDRTGWAAASVLTLLGVPRDEVFTDYLLTNERLVPALRPIFDEFAAAGGDPDLLLPVLGVREEYLTAAFDEVDRQYGSIDAYASVVLGLDASAVAELRSRFLD
ncbi:tyrosine-protein phosphatase [Gordonia humi]|uniref:Protein-tyrosine phosphatase n=1 Tax=Gordonia humi TaxID=686429 RepID=A0A840F636_9ACTN|nr:protein-tyrosine phosphatase [Gordonia humi]